MSGKLFFKIQQILDRNQSYKLQNNSEFCVGWTTVKSFTIQLAPERTTETDKLQKENINITTLENDGTVRKLECQPLSGPS